LPDKHNQWYAAPETGVVPIFLQGCILLWSLLGVYDPVQPAKK